MSTDTERYDVGLSYAGEDREKVEKVLLELSKRNIRAFYDRNEKPMMWGQNAARILGTIYTERCRHFMPFISAHYVKKAFPNFEYEKALTKAIKTREPEFVLPVRLDGSKFDLLDESVIYLNYDEEGPEEIAKHLAVKLGLPLDDHGTVEPLPDVDGSAPQIGVVDSGSDWRWGEDPRVKRHLQYMKAKYGFWSDHASWSMYATTRTHKKLSRKQLDETFLVDGAKYSEAFSYTRDFFTHASGFTREFPSHRRAAGETPIETWSVYKDGLITYDMSLTEEARGFREQVWLNLNATTYEILRFLQLCNEVFDPTDPYLDIVINFQNIGEVFVPRFYSGSHVGSYPYAGYHEPIVESIKRAEISGREEWSKICPPVRKLLTPIAQIFGLADIPQKYWDDGGTLDFVKSSPRR